MADVGNDESQGEPRIQPTGTTALLSQAQRDATFHKQRSLDMRYTVKKNFYFFLRRLVFTSQPSSVSLCLFAF